MSDPGNNSRRGPLPRTNRPRADSIDRRLPGTQADEHPSGPQSSAFRPGSDGAEPSPERPPRNSSVIDTGAAEPPRPLAERPTQLDTRPEMTPGPGAAGLKQAPLTRAGDGSGEEGPASTYVGYVIDGRYRIDGVLGRGGMGVVYRARHQVIDKVVAVKILLPNSDPDVVERFVNEARAATAIGNQHIVDTMDFGALPDGSTYFVMEYLEGQTLARRIKKERFIAIPHALSITRQIATGMNVAHRAGIVHRDLKPENIFLEPRDDGNDFVKLLDFGIAKVQYSQNRITRAGTIFGTPHYMSPEQASGREVDARSDIYSLGVILYEMLLGRVPFDAENPMGLLTQHMYNEPTPLTRAEDRPQEIPSTVDAVAMKCLSKKPEERYQTMADVILDLDRIERGQPPAALADLLTRAQRTEDRALLAAAREGLRRKESSGGRWVVAFLVVAAAGALGFAGFRERHGLSELARTYLSPTMSPSPPRAGAEPAAGKPIALVFDPIDAEVFRDGKSLGGMPVTVTLKPGENATVDIIRDGFYPEHVLLDGSRDVVVVRLSAIPGVAPMVPVPSAEPLEELRRAHPITGSIGQWVNAKHEAPARAARDAGLAVAPAPSPPPPPPVATTPPPAPETPKAEPSAAVAPPPAPSAAPTVEVPPPPAPPPPPPSDPAASSTPLGQMPPAATPP